MTYIISNANILRDSKLQKNSLLVEDSRIVSIKETFGRLRFTQMDAAPYIMTPAYVVFDPGIPLQEAFSKKKEYFIKHFILKGCTTVLALSDIHYEHEFGQKLKRLKASLAGSPIDYVTGVKIPLPMLTASFLRKCKKERIPAVFIELDNMDKLLSIPWGWLREAMFPYNSPLIPVFPEGGKREKKQAKIFWNALMKQEKIPYISEEIAAHKPMPLPVLKKIGIYPLKANLHHGGEASYNLYIYSTEITKIEESELFDYHNDRLLVTVHKGTVIRAGTDVCYRPGFGEYITIKTPSYYISG